MYLQMATCLVITGIPEYEKNTCFSLGPGKNEKTSLRIIYCDHLSNLWDLNLYCPHGLGIPTQKNEINIGSGVC